MNGGTPNRGLLDISNTVGDNVPLSFSQIRPLVYYAVVDPAKELVAVVEADFQQQAVEAAREEYDGNGTLHAREADNQEIFAYLVNQIGLSYTKLGNELDTSPTYVGHRIRDERTTRRLDVLALERLRQLKEKEK